jgi:hypothetical protein
MGTRWTRRRPKSPDRVDTHGPEPDAYKQRLRHPTPQRLALPRDRAPALDELLRLAMEE